MKFHLCGRGGRRFEPVVGCRALIKDSFELRGIEITGENRRCVYGRVQGCGITSCMSPDYYPM